MISPRPRWAVPTAWAFVAGVVVLGALAALLDAQVAPSHRGDLAVEAGWQSALTGLTLAVPGAFLMARWPRHPVAWALCLGGLLWAVDGLAASWLAYATTGDQALGGASAAFWVYHRLGASLLLILPTVLLLYPDGRLPGGRWRVASIVSLASTAALPVALLLAPAAVAQGAGTPLPDAVVGLDLDPASLPLPSAFWVPALAVAQALVPLSMVVPFLVVVRRVRGAVREDRTRMRWLLWAAVVDLIVMLAVLRAPELMGSIGLPIAVAITAAAVAAGIARPGVVDVDRLLGGTVVYGLLAVGVVVVDLVVVAATRAVAGVALSDADGALVALVVVIAVYGPLRAVVWRWVRRVVLGDREDPYLVVSGLAETLERSPGATEQLAAVARTAAEAFRSSYVGVQIDRPDGERLVAEHGHRPAEVQVLPIHYRGQDVGRLLLPRRGARTHLRGRDERLLGDVVRQAAAAARASDLADALQASREALVTAREEERRRLRRDLHDGLGPVLGSVVLRIDAARNLTATDPSRADDVLRAVSADVTAALDDVRRLVHDLRPPALDDLGLLGAIEQQAARYRGPGLAVEVTVHGGSLSALPAAVEVAAYRVASEALSNVARHARATRCRVQLICVGNALVIEVIDDGVGITSGAPAGVGLLSLRERAAELGGDAQVTSDGGTVVRVRLPIATSTINGAGATAPGPPAPGGVR